VLIVGRRAAEPHAVELPFWTEGMRFTETDGFSHLSDLFQPP
jgi:hypothetical protein